MTEPNAIETASGNTHYLSGEGTVCNPVKLPKGKLFVANVEQELRNPKTGEFLRMYTPTVVCHKCNKVRTGRR